MRVLRLLITNLGAFLMSFITRPLLGWCLSRYWLYVLNRILGCFITVAIILNISDLSDEQISNFIVWGTFILYALVKISETTPKGQEYLKLWYEEGSEEDDKEYFSNKDMRGKPWWKFMFIPGWITIIVFNLAGFCSWLAWYPEQWKGPLFFTLFGLFITGVVIHNAKIRKRNYDNDYK